MSQSHPGKDVFGKLSWATLALGLALAAISYLAYVASLDLIMTPELAGDVLLGQEILRQKSLVPTAWYYGDTLGTIGVPAFSAFFSLFNAGYLLSYRLGVLLMLGLELISFSYMADRLRLTRTSSLLFLGIFLGARSFVSGTWSGMGFCLLGMYHVMFFLAVGYLSARDQGNFGRPEKALRFLLPALSFLLGLEGLLILLVLLVPLVLLRPVRLPWRPAPARGPRPSFREVALWAALGLLGYLCLSFLVLPRGFGPSLPYTTEITGAYHAVMGNIPSLFVSFLDDTPLWAIKGPAHVMALTSLASFAFLTFCAYSLYVARASYRSAVPALAFPLRLLLVGLVLTFLLTIICVPQARIKSLFYFYILLAFIIVIYHNYLESDNPRLASLLVLACGALLILTGLANLKDLGRLGPGNPAAAVIRNRASIEKVASDFHVERLYALQPDSFPLEAISDGRLRVGALMPDLTPFTYAGSAEMFVPGNATERVALVLPLKGANSNIYRTVESDPLLSKASERLRIPDKETPIDVLVFDANPFTFAGRKAAFPDLADPSAQTGMDTVAEVPLNPCEGAQGTDAPERKAVSGEREPNANYEAGKASDGEPTVSQGESQKSGARPETEPAGDPVGGTGTPKTAGDG